MTDNIKAYNKLISINTIYNFKNRVYLYKYCKYVVFTLLYNYVNYYKV